MKDAIAWDCEQRDEMQITVTDGYSQLHRISEARTLEMGGLDQTQDSTYSNNPPNRIEESPGTTPRTCG